MKKKKSLQKLSELVAEVKAWLVLKCNEKSNTLYVISLVCKISHLKNIFFLVFSSLILFVTMNTACKT